VNGILISSLLSQAIESTDLVPFEGDTAKLNRRAAEFESTYHESIKRNLPAYLPLTMETLSELHKKTKTSSMNEASKKMVSISASHAMSPPVGIYWSRRTHALAPIGFRHPACKIKILGDVRRHAAVPDASGSVLVPCAAGRRDRIVMAKLGACPLVLLGSKRTWARVQGAGLGVCT
jgi:hypothetical protein